MQERQTSRRTLLKTVAATGLASLGGNALAQAFPFTPNQRYPDPAVLILDPSFARYRIYSSTVEQVASGMRWAEGPAYFPEGGYLLLSDIPNNRIMKFDERTGRRRGQPGFQREPQQREEHAPRLRTGESHRSGRRPGRSRGQTRTLRCAPERGDASGPD